MSRYLWELMTLAIPVTRRAGERDRSDRRESTEPKRTKDRACGSTRDFRHDDRASQRDGGAPGEPSSRAADDVGHFAPRHASGGTMRRYMDERNRALIARTCSVAHAGKPRAHLQPDSLLVSRGGVLCHRVARTEHCSEQLRKDSGSNVRFSRAALPTEEAASQPSAARLEACSSKAAHSWQRTVAEARHYSLDRAWPNRCVTARVWLAPRVQRGGGHFRVWSDFQALHTCRVSEPHGIGTAWCRQTRSCPSIAMTAHTVSTRA